MKRSPNRVPKMKLIDRFLNAVFPEKVACISCGREAVLNGSYLCADCEVGVERFVSAPVLAKVDGYTAVYIYNDVSGRMIKRLKYNNAKFIAKPLSESIEIPEDWEIDAVVPVPLHSRRVRDRGYNQSELIAKHLCRRLGLNMDTDLLKRVSDTKQQAKLSPAARLRNLKGAFRTSEDCTGKRVLLIDDVRTTGATLYECASELKKGGCDKVYAATVCFAKGDKGGSV